MASEPAGELEAAVAERSAILVGTGMVKSCYIRGMEWQMAAAIVAVPLIREVYRRWQAREKPFDGTWTVARLITPILQHHRAEKSGVGKQRGELLCLPAPIPSEQSGELPTIDGPPAEGTTEQQ